MNRLLPSSWSSPRPQTLALLIILAAGMAARVYVMWRFEPAPGDGLLRALMADWWVQGLAHLDTTPVEYGRAGWWYLRLPTTGPWPPGYTVLTGLFGLPFHDALFSASLLSLLLGVLSILLLYYVIIKTFDAPIALLSAATLSFLPLHVTLSANPLTEVPALFFLLAILALLMRAIELEFPYRFLFPLVILTTIGTMIRYEIWLILPIISAAYLYVRRAWWPAILVSIIISVAPLLWLLSSWLHYGSLLANFGSALPDVDRLGLAGAALLIISKLNWSAGPFIVVASVLGGSLALMSVRLERTSVNRMIYLGVVLLQMAFLVWFASQRGATLWSRYVAICVALIIPFAAYALSRDRSVVSHCLVGLAMIGSMLFANDLDPIGLYIRRNVPDEVSAAAAWLDGRLGPEETFISTRLQGDAHMIGLITGSTPHNVAYANDTDEQLKALWNVVQPSYLIVLANEEPGVRLLQQFEGQIDLSGPVERFGQISIYRVKHDVSS